MFLADYTIVSDPSLAPGVYLLQPGSNTIAYDGQGSSVPVSTSTYQVTVVPEPGSAALVAPVVIGLMRRRRRGA